MIVIADASTVIGLSFINKLSLLSALFKEVIIPTGVNNEITKGKFLKQILALKYLRTAEVNDQSAVELMLESFGRGEAEVLVLANELNAHLLLMDDRKARKTARRAGFKVIGILGILLLAKEKRLIKTVKPLIHSLQERGFRLSDRVIEEVLKQAGEGR